MSDLAKVIDLPTAAPCQVVQNVKRRQQKDSVLLHLSFFDKNAEKYWRAVIEGEALLCKQFARDGYHYDLPSVSRAGRIC
jgi:hypothetical protein